MNSNSLPCSFEVGFLVFQHSYSSISCSNQQLICGQKSESSDSKTEQFFRTMSLEVLGCHIHSNDVSSGCTTVEEAIIWYHLTNGNSDCEVLRFK